MRYPVALALTLLTETPVYTAALVRAGQVRPGRAATAAVLVNLVTHPLLWWTLRHWTGGPAAAYWTAFGLSEAAVCVVEALLLCLFAGLRPRDPLPWIASGTANTTSLLAGLLAAPLLGP
ncbi:hypothetical protein [Kitasatospora aureofaciens]|uniref:hypothetical protein n=1 Tax=Kitasatospora aureofaciens TaxID=1894 RepID=UPI001C46B239|nr:hypothetical protein [Kitasatospora aureofaciens]MBV6701366.1 hypothetical protein [Kitasatospora aureofaciens]